MSDCETSTGACSTDPGPPDLRCTQRHPTLKHRCVHMAAHSDAAEERVRRHHFAVVVDGGTLCGGWSTKPVYAPLIDFGGPRVA